MTVRIATIEDIKGIKALDKEFEKESNIGGEKRKYYKRCVNAERIFVAEKDGSIVGFLLFTLKKAKRQEYKSLKKGQNYVFVDYLFITKKYRSNGVGNELMKAVEDYAKTIKISHVYLYAVSNEPERLIGFYKNKGYGVSYVMMFKKFDLNL